MVLIHPQASNTLVCEYCKDSAHVLEAGHVVDVEQVAVDAGGGVRVRVRGGQVRQPLPRRDLRRLHALGAERGPLLRSISKQGLALFVLLRDLIAELDAT